MCPVTLHELKYELCRTERPAKITINGEAKRKRTAVKVASLRVNVNDKVPP
jgi:hypothetical protein